MKYGIIAFIGLSLVASVALAGTEVPKVRGNVGVSPGGSYQNDLAPFAAQTSLAVTDYVLRPERVKESKQWWDDRIKEAEREKSAKAGDKSKSTP